MPETQLISEDAIVKGHTEQITVNMGPQHPSTHGVLRLVLTLDGETVTSVDVVLGYLHRGVEKLCEEGTYTQNISLTDRLDYVASMTNNWAYVMAVEQLAGIEVPERAEYIRVVMAELQRIASHCVALGTFAADLGTAFTPLMYMFRDREYILDLFEMTCGARLTYNYYRIGGVSADLPEEFIPKARELMRVMPGRIDEYEGLLTGNEILVARTRNVGVLPAEMAINYSLAGPVLRGSGVPFDVRKAVPYGVYPRLAFQIPVGTRGDNFDRYIVRIHEMRQSVRIVEQALDQLPAGKIANPVPLNFRPPVGEALSRIEGPRGEVGFYVVSDGSIAPYRCHERPPSFVNLGVVQEVLVGCKVADAVATLASLDTVMGEVDR
ncbi:MAG: NADH-quinone oxidoreductase subunit D [Chloroflexi bacterium]|nr:NADH-quinone oxidoreductase subunit D [Chloroflexota bacterium]